MNYLWHILVMTSIYAVLAASLNVVAGYTGLLSLCHAAFYGIGAYATTLLIMDVGLGFFPALGLAVLLTASLGLAIAVPVLRLKGDYFVLGTLGFQVIVLSILHNWIDLTNGPYGIPGIPIPQVFGIPVDNTFRYFIFCAFFAAISLGLLWILLHSPFGRVLRAVRDDDVASGALGKDVVRIRVTAFVLGAGFAAVPGGLFAGYVRYVDPTSFTLMESVFILSIVIIGGAGSFWGPVVGAAFMVILPEGLRFLHIPDAIAANLRQITYGLLLVFLMRFRPHGFIGKYGFE